MESRFFLSIDVYCLELAFLIRSGSMGIRCLASITCDSSAIAFMRPLGTVWSCKEADDNLALSIRDCSRSLPCFHSRLGIWR